MLYSGRQKGIACVFRYSTYSAAQPWQPAAR